jgi:flagellar basal-body rod modification protein FlgD
VSAISAVSTASNSASASSTQKKSNLDYQSFLKLLVTQMKNQDPTKPMDSTEYVAQLATFSNVEQAINANKKLDQLIQDSKISQGVGLIGREVTSLDGLGAGIVEKVRFTQDGTMATLSDGSELAINTRVVIGS